MPRRTKARTSPPLKEPEPKKRKSKAGPLLLSLVVVIGGLAVIGFGGRSSTTPPAQSLSQR